LSTTKKIRSGQSKKKYAKKQTGGRLVQRIVGARNNKT
jgi:hypothetical protein